VAHDPHAAVDEILAPRLLSFDIESNRTFREDYKEYARKLEDFN
jgi:hypothetical protein